MNIVQTKHGLMMVRQGSDLISNYLVQKGEYEWHVVDICRLLAGRHDNGYVLDIGANMGTVTVPLAKLLPKYTIRAFEPQRAVYYQLCGNVALNDIDNVEVRQLAVGSESRHIYLDMPDYKTNNNIGAWSMDPEVREKSPEGRAGGAMQPVKMERLDDMHFSEPIRLIKIDVEGMELDVLRGAFYLLDHHKYPPLVYESWECYDWFKPRAEELEAHVMSLGYKTYRMGPTVVAIHPDNGVKVNVVQDGDGTTLQVVSE